MINDLAKLPGCVSRLYILAWMTLKKKNKGSDLGWIWSILKPLMYVGMFYVAISMGFRNAKNIDGIHCPYFIWLSCGIIPWQYIQELLLGGASCFKKNKPLIHGTDLPLTSYPLLSAMSGFYVHCAMVVILLIMAVGSNVKPTIYWIQIPFFMCICFVFLYFWAFLTGMLNTISMDIINVIKSIKPAFFWLSGIFFNSRTRSSIIFTYNPITFIIEGYRDALCFNEWFWQNTAATKGFCLVMLILIALTFLLYSRMKNRIAELL